MPANTVYVGRPSKWKNPYVMISEEYRQIAIDFYRTCLTNKLRDDPHFLDELKGKDLACWCPLNLQCHADILLEYLRKADDERREQNKLQ